MARARVEPALAGQRVDHLVASLLPGLSVAAARRLLDEGAVRVDGRPPRKGERLMAGQTVEVDDAALQGTRPAAVVPDPSVPIEIVFADEVLVALAKPAGIPSHPLRPGQLGTAANALVVRFPECATASTDLREAGLANRLDVGTSGLLLAARRPETWAPLRAALTGPDCQKTYLAEVTGTPPDAGAASESYRPSRPAGGPRAGGRGPSAAGSAHRVDGGGAPSRYGPGAGGASFGTAPPGAGPPGCGRFPHRRRRDVRRRDRPGATPPRGGHPIPAPRDRPIDFA